MKGWIPAINRAIIATMVLMVLPGCQQKDHSTSGYVSSNLIYLNSPLGGTLTQLAVKKGQGIKKGALLFKLDPQPQKDNLTAHQTNVNQALADYNSLKKQKRLQGSKQLATARRQLIQARALRNASRFALSSKTVSAPAAGTVHHIFYQQGEYVPATRPVISLIPQHAYKIVFYVNQADLHSIKLGQVVQARCDGCHTFYPATVNYISQKAAFTPDALFDKQNRQRLSFRVEAKLDKQVDRHFRLGQGVDVQYDK